jgi:putative methylase
MNFHSKPIKKKRHLEMILQSIPGHINPKVELEQYSTPSIIAADILWTAYALGDIENKNVADLGCGTGIFAIGAAILGAKNVCAIDIDVEALQIARETSLEKGLGDNVKFVEWDIRNSIGECNNEKCNEEDISDIFHISDTVKFEIDTVIQNPPFGSQSRSEKGSDRIFMEKSMKMASVIYSFHMAETEEFVENYFSKLGGKVTHKFFYHFPLPKIYHFHKKESKDIEVIVVRVERINNLL